MQLNVIKEAKAEDGTQVIGEKYRAKGRSDGAVDTVEDHGVPHAPIAFNADVVNENGWRLSSLC